MFYLYWKGSLKGSFKTTIFSSGYCSSHLASLLIFFSALNLISQDFRALVVTGI